MASKFGVIPDNTPASPEPFTLHVAEEELVAFRDLLRLSKIGPSTWWNQQNDPQYGVSRQWLIGAKETWLNKFDWRKHENYINSFPNFKLPISDPEAGRVDVHFAALFSARKDAIPLLFLVSIYTTSHVTNSSVVHPLEARVLTCSQHGFPASFTEFLPMLELLVDKYTPETLPYHVIVPSLPDYGLSRSASQQAEMTLTQAARIMNQLMLDLGYGQGYVVQGGDLGSMLSRIMSVEYESCKAFHVNMLVADPALKAPSLDLLSSEESQIVQRTETWRQTGLAYALEHGTRPATVGLAISASPLSMLAWIGEKLLEWTDPRHQFSLDTILGMVTFYWFTETFPRSLYHATLVKNIFAGKPHPTSMEKPLGYSLFAYDLCVLPKPWAEQIYPNLTLFKAHSEGGHFASIEQPRALLDDVEEFVEKVSHLFKGRG
ncbi:Alpha/Beta hydrolase protein [Xylaria cubensis]|nr:Alpha/Beta hydrolase protein [Xylaria cubensis]